jgi:hypothetical protein
MTELGMEPSAIERRIERVTLERTIGE